MTAQAYRHYCRTQSADDVIKVDSWCRLVYGSREHAQLFRELHNWNPQAADRLARALVAMPAIGTDFFDFQLDAQLGYGAFARVYLARQGKHLANRHVVVKITADFWGEALHWHAAASISCRCIRYIATVQIVHAVSGCTTLHVSSVYQQLDHCPARGAFIKASKPPCRGRLNAPSIPPRARLAKLSYVEYRFVGGQLADGLAYAHEHGIVHTI